MTVIDNASRPLERLLKSSGFTLEESHTTGNDDRIAKYQRRDGITINFSLELNPEILDLDPNPNRSGSKPQVWIKVTLENLAGRGYALLYDNGTEYIVGGSPSPTEIVKRIVDSELAPLLKTYLPP